MATYKYTIKNYHAIKEADITLDGITVLSGVNGCGKSTLSRWLYYIINGSANYDENLFKDYQNDMYHLLNRIIFAFKDIDRSKKISNGEDDNLLQKVFLLAKRLKEFQYSSDNAIDNVYALFNHAIVIVGKFISDVFPLLSKPKKARILSFLRMDVDEEDCDYYNLFVQKYQFISNNHYNKLTKDLKNRPIQLFYYHIDYYDGDTPKYINLEEDGVEVLNNTRVYNIFNLRNAIYVDTPVSVTANDNENPFWKSLHEMMLADNKKDLSFEMKVLLRRIENLMGGVTYVEEDEILEDKTLRFRSSDNEINIDLSNVATGFKTLAYLQRLLENGYLNENTLLMIDEPEAHLHPQWIVDFAKLLVLLNKTLGLKIMLASHNPDMVAAIQAIASREGVSEYTNFYVAKPDAETPHQYVYKHLGTDVSEIFESFNIAIDSIRCYGDVCD